uniref:THUMP domain-containing protein 1-like n=1 Tax=Phallusia mammillata TaxID=59560 RepID=A0A6F9DU40_9ASCI|nr:THUMP domain-containing protein 1-like [Phallusia mammillata]
MGKKRKFYNGSKQDQYKRFKDGECGKISPGVTGIIVTHDRGREKLCRNDVFKVLNHFADLWYGSELKQNSEDQSTESDDENDIDSALNEEIKNIKDVNSKQKTSMQRFCSLKSGCNNIIFIKTKDLKPSELVQRIMETVYKEDELDDLPLPRHVLRMHPVAKSCKAHLIDIKAEVETYLPIVLAEILKKNEDTCKKEFAILYRGRNNDHLGMHIVVEAVCDSANLVVPEWSYNCRTDDVVLLIDVIQTVCMMSVVQNYAYHKKFNLRELCKPHAEKVVDQKQEKGIIKKKKLIKPAENTEKVDQ